MTFDEFRAAHPNVFQYDRAGIEGIDFGALHEKIEKSRYLKSRQSFVYMVKHYSEILAGRYDDFTLEIMPDNKADPKEAERNEIKDYIAKLKLIPEDLKEKIYEETWINIDNVITEFRFALNSLDCPTCGYGNNYKGNALDRYKTIQEFLYGVVKR